jgi:hypothetical protein
MLLVALLNGTKSFMTPQSVKADLHTFASAVSAYLPDKIVFKEMGGVPGPKKILEQLVNVYNL